MLNTTYNIDRSDKSTNVKVDAKNEQLSIKKTCSDSKITCVKFGSDAFNLLMGEEPFLIGETTEEREEPFHNYGVSHLYPFLQRIKEYYTHGVTILQIQRNGEYVFIEYVDRECKPKLCREYIKELTEREALQQRQQD